jgi:hypothetical protein
MAVKVLKIEMKIQKCGECVYARTYPDRGWAICAKADKPIAGDGNPVPEWCPLPDKEEK